MILSNRMSLSAGTARLYASRQANTGPEENTPIIAIPCGEAFAVIVQLADFKLHKLWHDGRLVHSGGHAKQALAITDLTEDWRCQHLSPFDNVRLLIPRQALDEFTYDSGQKRIGRLDCAPGTTDPVMFHLAQALVPLMDMAGGAPDFLIEHISLALLAHLTAAYGNAPSELTRRKGRLAPWQEQRAKEYMLENMAKGISLEQIAKECRLSRAHFARYFKNTTGTSAYAWLQKMRILKAQELLGGHEQSLTQIALECGFTDQSHFSRVFKSVIGTPPGSWQRNKVKGHDFTGGG
ncbi:AraC family transcriptional regulator [Sodalis sp. dw_96]|uniref:helix-turn-helix domain-containing protein n=1 Tax=Sodalis sp. dw_96 TaxID=2719794 RepID=UPI001BD523E9|nr:AraC family transcriptional regulator [Sodalis sp. dw_96]